ncbi:MAG: histidine kinase N-terminal 7TM domain-containing protein, partial [Candidatus Omnitrophica bacterium]|nr:histidine kinase N-terminal 7TM domain-containing protein [Candidatus Omnitrophota bacterium]
MFIQGMFVYLRNRKSVINSVFALFCLCYTFIMFGTFMMFISKSSNLAIYWDKFIYLGATFIPAVWYHLIVSFLKIDNRKVLIKINYLICFVFFILSRSHYFIDNLYIYSWGVHSQARFFHHIFIICFTLIVLIGLNDLRIGYSRVVSPLQRNQMKYLSFGIFIVSLTGIGFLAAYNVSIYPLFYQIFGILFTVIIAYAIVRYRLMDVKVAITRTGTFIAVYTLVLGFPFVVAIYLRPWLIDIFRSQWWVAPLGLMAALATFGPFIYIYFDRRAEERLLRDQRRYQETLKQASVGMTRIRDLHRLLDLIAHIVTKTVRISYAAIYLRDAQASQYVLQVSRDKGRISLPSIPSDNFLINWLAKKRDPLVYEEIKRQMEDMHQHEYAQIEEQMRLLTASVIIPSF